MTTVALTAASSFTGLWIANHLAEKYKVQALFTARNYDGLKKIRLDNLDSRITRHFDVKAEDGSMAKWIRQNKPDFWIHHHHFMESFRSPQYDTKCAEKVSLGPLREIAEALKSSGC